MEPRDEKVSIKTEAISFGFPNLCVAKASYYKFCNLKPLLWKTLFPGRYDDGTANKY